MRTRTDWRGEYLDGRTSRAQPADLRLMATGIEIHVDGGATAFWPYGEIRQTQGRYAGEEVRLEHGGELSEALIVRDRDFLASLRAMGGVDMGAGRSGGVQAAGRAGGRPRGGRWSGSLYDPERRRLRIGLTVGAGLSVVALAGALYLWGIPLLARVVAAQVPVAWEEGLGASVLREVSPPAQRCEDPARLQRVEAVVNRLAAALPQPVPYRFRVVVDRRDVVNALAAPGGFIVVFRGLLDRTETPEEVAGVLAHEMQHVVQRHTTRMVVQHASTGLLVAALTGDVTGVMAYGLESARVLGALQYGRLAEEEADREGMRLLLAARIDPAGMIAFFGKLETERESGPAVLKYLSSHPRLEDRIARLKAMAAEPGRPAPVKLFEDYDWRDIRRICPAVTPR